MKTDRNDQTTTTVYKPAGDSKAFLDSTLLNVSNLVGRRKPSSGAVSGLSCIDRTTLMEPYGMDSTQLSDKDYLEIELSMRQQYIDRLKQQLSMTIRDINSLEDKYRTLKIVAKRFEERLTRTLADNAKLKEEKVVLAAQNIKLKQEGQLRLICKEQLEQQCGQLRNQLMQAKERYAEYQEENDELHQQLAYLKLEVVRMSDRQSQSLCKLDEAYQQLSELQECKQKYSSVSQSEKELSKGITTLQLQLEASKHQVSTLSQQNSALLKCQIEAVSRCEKAERDYQQEVQSSKQANQRLAQLEQEYLLEKAALQTQLKFFIDTVEQLTSSSREMYEDKGKYQFTREAMETAMNSSRLLTQFNAADKQNRRIESNGNGRYQRNPSKIRVIESCEQYSFQPSQRRIGLIKGPRFTRDCMSTGGPMSTVEQSCD